MGGTGGPPPATAPAGPPSGFAIAVETAVVRVGPVQRQIQAVGSLRSNESVIIRPEVPGRIAQILFSESQRVARGTPLVTLDAAIARAGLNEAKASLALSQANYQRSQDMMERGAGSVRSRDEALAKLRADEARLQSAQARLDKTSIAAPLGGDRPAQG